MICDQDLRKRRNIGKIFASVFHNSIQDETSVQNFYNETIFSN